MLLVVGYPRARREHVLVCGPVGENPPIVADLEVSQVERLCATALAEPTRHAAVRFLVAMLPEVGSDLPGVRNAGLYRDSEAGVWGTGARRLERCMPGKQAPVDVGRAATCGAPRLPGEERLSTTASVLTARDAKRAIAVFLDESETFEDPSARFGATPVSHGLALADREATVAGSRVLQRKANPALCRPAGHRSGAQGPRDDFS